jgi:putative transposase
MKQARFTEEQIAFALRQAEAGTPVVEVIRKLGISEQTFYRWKKKYAGMGVGRCGGSNSWKRRTGSSNSW